jgi:hypothetical protein
MTGFRPAKWHLKEANMNRQSWPEELRHKLREQDLPPAYINRLVEELSDHLIDSQTETSSMEAQNALCRLGSSDQIAAAATHEFRRRTFAGRHPWLTFVVAPFAFVPLLFVSLILALFAVAWILGTTVEWLNVPESWLSPSPATHSRIEWWILTAYDFYVRFIPFVLAAWIFCRLGRGSGLRWWPVIACSIVALTAGFLFTKCVPANGDKPGMWIIGLATHFHGGRQVIQLLVPLAIAVWMLLRLPRGLSASGRTQNAIAT